MCKVTAVNIFKTTFHWTIGQWVPVDAADYTWKKKQIKN